MLEWLRDKWRRDLATLRQRREKGRRDRKALCPRCGYDVKILPDHPCPECGLLVKSSWREGRLGAGSPNRDILASIGMFGCPSVVFYIGLVAGTIAIRGRGRTSGWGAREDIAVLATVSLVSVTHLALAAYGWRNRQRYLYGPLRPAVIYFAVCLILVVLTFGLWALLPFLVVGSS